MAIELIDVRTRRHFRQWVRFPYLHYSDHPVRVPQFVAEELDFFDKRRNPAFQVCEVKLLLALKDGRAAGRVCALVNRLETAKLGHRRGRFGWFESVDDRRVAHALLDAAREWHLATGCAEMTGPHGFTDLDVEGLLVDGYSAVPTAAGAYNYPYYPELLESYGLTKAVDYLDYRLEVPAGPTALDKLGRRARESGDYRVREVRDRKHFTACLEEMWPVLEAGFEPLYGVVPLTPEQQAFYTRKYFRFLDPQFFVFMDSREGELVAFIAAMPNISRGLRQAAGRRFPTGLFHVLRDLKHPETVDFLVAGALPDHPGGTLTALGLSEIFQTLRRRGIRYVETNHELETNISVNQLWRRFTILETRRSRIYRMSL